MAGRGTDIKLGQGVAKLGGLAVISTEMLDPRVAEQLQGRAGRQGVRATVGFSFRWKTILFCKTAVP